MAHQEHILVDPFLKESKGKERIPRSDSAELICSYDLDFSLDSTEEAAYLLREDNQDKLWIETSYEAGFAYVVTTERDTRSASLKLIERLFRDRVGFYWPTELITPGIVNRRSFAALIWKIQRELDNNRTKAQKKRSEIVSVAEGLGLSPRPTGNSASSWAANCPGTNHHLYLSSKSNTFGCGWCKRKGEVEELRKFTEERRRK